MIIGVCIFVLAMALQPFQRRPDDVSHVLLALLRLRIQRVESRCPNPEISSDTEVPWQIFTFWHDELLPPIPSIAMRHAQHVLAESGEEWQLHVLTPATVDTFLPGARAVMEVLLGAGRSVALFTDWLRLSLLLQYGGIWLDVTVLLNDASLLLQWRHRVLHEQLELFAIRNDMHQLYESWFLLARRGSQFIAEWLVEVEKALVIGPDHYCTLADVSFRVRLLLPGHYWAIYYAQEVVLRDMQRLDATALARTITSEPGSKYGFSWQTKQGWGSIKSNVKNLLDPAAPAKHGLIKLTNWDRRSLRGHEAEMARVYI